MFGEIVITPDDLKKIVHDYCVAAGYDVQSVEITGDINRPAVVKFKTQYKKVKVEKKAKQKPVKEKVTKEQKSKQHV